MKLAECLLAATLVAAASTGFASTALADRRVFIVANQPDSYGIDQCLANGDRCGASAARAYCQSHDFKSASAYHRVDPEEITGAVPTLAGDKCAGRACAVEYVAITCER
jgi:hypothetical protein